MYFLTQRGLKIRLDKEYCIVQSNKSLIGFQEILSRTEIFVTLRDFLAFAYGTLFLFFWASPITIIAVAFFTAAIGMAIPLHSSTIKLYTKFNLDTLFFEEVFSIINARHVDKLIILIVGSLRVGFLATMVFFASYYITIAIFSFFNYRWSKKMYKQTEIYFSDVERTFINILRTHTKPKISFHEWIDNYKAYITKNQTIIDS